MSRKTPSARSKLHIILITILVITQVFFLLGLTASYYNLVRNGTEIRIRTTPLESYYYYQDNAIHLTYEMSELNTALWKGKRSIDEASASNTSVYVLMARTSPDDLASYEAIGVYDVEPEAVFPEVWVKARLAYSYRDRMNINYGFERFTYNENKRKELESVRGAKIAVLKVSSSGKAIIVDLLNE